MLREVALDANGAPMSGALLYTYAAGGTSALATYADAALTIANKNPVVADGAGVFGPIYLSAASYRFDLKSAAGVTFYTQDNVTPGLSSAGGTLSGDLLFTDALYDIGKSAATRPRDEFLSRDLTVGRNLIAPALVAGICQGRLTLTTLTPVTTADVTAATTIYFTPYAGRSIALYDGTTNWTLLPFAETSLALGTLTSGLPYDVFAYNNAGTLALELLAWTSSTARATALVLQDGVLSKTGALTRRYLGTFYTTATTTTEDSAAKRFLWNYYNRVPRMLRVLDATASWQYTLTTIRQARATAANQLDLVVGVAEVLLHAMLTVSSRNNTNDVGSNAAFGEDSTTAFMANQTYNSSVNWGPVAAAYRLHIATIDIYPAIGRHFYSWNESSIATGTTTWGGTENVAGAGLSSGMSGFIHG